MTTRDNVTWLNTSSAVHHAALRKAKGRILGFEYVLLRNPQYAVWYVWFNTQRPFPACEVSLDHDTEDWYRRDIIDHSR